MPLPAIEPGTPWTWDAAAEAAPDHDDATWMSSVQPQPIGAGNFQNGYGWYRAKFTVSPAENVSATLGGGVQIRHPSSPLKTVNDTGASS
jgi:hypothetical protein